MNSKTSQISKDNVGSTVLLAAMIITIATAMFSSRSVEAKEVSVTAPKAQATATAKATPRVQVETLVVTATRLK